MKPKMLLATTMLAFFTLVGANAPANPVTDQEAIEWFCQGNKKTAFAAMASRQIRLPKHEAKVIILLEAQKTLPEELVYKQIKYLHDMVDSAYTVDVHPDREMKAILSDEFSRIVYERCVDDLSK